MTKDEATVTNFVMHATPGEIARLAAFIENGCKADVAPVAASNDPLEKKLCTYPEAAKIMGCSAMTVRRLHWEGKVEVSTIRGRQKVVLASLRAYIEQAKTAPRKATAA